MRKSLNVLFALVLAFSLVTVIVPAPTAAQDPAPEVWVDDDWAGLNPGDPADGHTFGTDAFANIQDGIDAVGGSTVHVAAGIYYENITLRDGVEVLALMLPLLTAVKAAR